MTPQFNCHSFSPDFYPSLIIAINFPNIYPASLSLKAIQNTSIILVFLEHNSNNIATLFNNQTFNDTPHLLQLLIKLHAFPCLPFISRTPFQAYSPASPLHKPNVLAKTHCMYILPCLLFKYSHPIFYLLKFSSSFQVHIKGNFLHCLPWAPPCECSPSPELPCFISHLWPLFWTAFPAPSHRYSTWVSMSLFKNANQPCPYPSLTHTHTHTPLLIQLSHVLIFQGLQDHRRQNGQQEVYVTLDRFLKVLILLPINQITFLFLPLSEMVAHLPVPYTISSTSVFMSFLCWETSIIPPHFHLIPNFQCVSSPLLLPYLSHVVLFPIQCFPLRLSSETVLAFSSIWNVFVMVTRGVGELPIL